MTVISTMRYFNRTTAIVAASVLAACHSSAPTGTTQTTAAALPALPATLPLATGSATTATIAPSVAALPAAAAIGAVRVARPDDRYAYAESARSFSDAIGSAPPDYGFAYEEVRPWAWQGYDDSTEFVEPVAGGYRYYYYRPGADAPYFVRDPDYGYGYDGGQLAVVYAPDGSVLPYGAYGARSDYAARYYARARALYAASRQRQRHAVIAANWAERQPSINASEQRWSAQQAAQRDWQAYHDRVSADQQQHWAQEQARRRADTARYDAWHDQDFRTPPPPRAIPVAWAAAAWAGNARNYAPPAPGFDGNAAARQQATRVEQQRIAAAASRPAPQAGQDAHVPPPTRSGPPQPPQARPKPGPLPAPSQPTPAPIAARLPARPVTIDHPRPDRAPREARPASPPNQHSSPPRAPHERHDSPRVPAEPRQPAPTPHDAAPSRPEKPAAPPPRHAAPDARPPAAPPSQHKAERPGAPEPQAPAPRAPARPPHAPAQPRPAPSAA